MIYLVSVCFSDSLDTCGCSKQTVIYTKDLNHLYLYLITAPFGSCRVFRYPMIPNLSDTTATGLCPKQLPVLLKSMKFYYWLRWNLKLSSNTERVLWNYSFLFEWLQRAFPKAPRELGTQLRPISAGSGFLLLLVPLKMSFTPTSPAVLQSFSPQWVYKHKKKPLLLLIEWCK